MLVALYVRSFGMALMDMEWGVPLKGPLFKRIEML